MSDVGIEFYERAVCATSNSARQHKILFMYAGRKVEDLLVY